MDNQLAKKVSIDCVKEAGKKLIESFDKVKPMPFEEKNEALNQLSLELERMMIKRIKENFRDHSILSEEKGFIDGNSRYIWVMDPIDGVVNYYNGTTPFRVAICLLEDKEPLISAIYNPIRGQLYFAEREKGATLDGKKIRVNKSSDLGNSIVMTHISSKKEGRTRIVSSLEHIFNHVLNMRLLGSAMAAMTYVANGNFEVFFEVKTYPWDVFPGALLIEEAGGMVTDMEGRRIDMDSTSVLATNGKVHSQMLDLLKDI